MSFVRDNILKPWRVMRDESNARATGDATGIVKLLVPLSWSMPWARISRDIDEVR
jgi:hypothetical protein